MNWQRLNRSIQRLLLCVSIIGLHGMTAAPSLHAQNDDFTQTLEPITVQLRWYHQFQFAGYYAAIEHGFYRDAGLDVTLAEYREGINVVDEVLNGRAQYGATNSEILLYRLQHQPVVVLAAILQHSPVVLVVRKDSGVATPQDLIRKSFKMTATTRNIELLAMFKNEGIDLKLLNIVSGGAAPADLFDPSLAAVNGYLTNQPFYLEQRGVPYVIINPITYGIDFYGDCLFTSEAELRNHPQRVKAFRDATLKGWNYAMLHVEEMINLILTKYPSGKTRAALQYEAAKTRELMLPDLIEIGHLNPGRWEHIARTFVNLGFVEPGYSLDNFIYDPSPTPDYRRIYWLLAIVSGISGVIALIALMLWQFNRRLHQEIVERKQADDALRESEERFRRTFEQAAVGIGHVAPDGRFLRINQRYCDIVGYSQSEMLAHTFQEITHPDDLNTDLSYVRQVLDNTLQIYHLEKRYIHKEQFIVWVNLTVSLVREVSGQPKYFIAVIEDISQRKQMEDALRNTNEFLERVFATTHFLLAYMDTQYRFIRVNRAYADADLQPPESFVGKNHFTLYPNAENEMIFRQVVDTGEPVSFFAKPFEYAEHPERGVTYWDWDLYPIKDSAGKVEGLLLSLVNVTERQRMENALRESEERYRALFDEAGASIALIDIETQQVVGFNRQNHEHLGYTAEEFAALGIADVDLATPEDVMRYVQELRTFGKARIDTKHRAKNGELRDMLINARLISYHGKQVIQGIGHDITDLKRAEAEIRTLNAELEQRVQHRTAELEAANDELKSFAYIVSHDLKAPLRGITQLANWLVEDYASAFDDNGKEMAALLISRVKRMDNLIEGILEYSRIGRIIGKEVSFNLHDLLQEVIDLLAPPPHITLYIQPEMPTILADKTRMTEVFQNLIGNAVKFLDKPDGNITIGCADQCDCWEFQVTDNGPGIEEKYYDKIFQLFQTLPRRGEQDNTSSGIGLAVVKKIVEFYGGRIWVKSLVGVGSAFFFTLPKVRND